MIPGLDQAEAKSYLAAPASPGEAITFPESGTGGQDGIRSPPCQKNREKDTEEERGHQITPVWMMDRRFTSLVSAG